MAVGKASSAQPSEVGRVSLSGPAVPGSVRPGFNRSWGVQVVSDMWQTFPVVTNVSVSAAVEPRIFSDCVVVTLDDDLRLNISVSHSCADGVTFTVLASATAPSGCVLPLSLGPVFVASKLQYPVRPAPWARVVPLRGIAGRRALSVHEEQDSTSVIASSTWDPGVLMAAYISEAVLAARAADPAATAAGGLRAILRGLSVGSSFCALSDAPLRCVEVGSGCGIAGLALAAACPHSRVLLTDGDPRACALASKNVANNGLSGRVEARRLTWRSDCSADVAEACAVIGGPPHIVLAADVVYREETFVPLVDTLVALCDADRASRAEVLFAYRPRVDDEHFFHLLEEAFEMTQIVAPGVTKRLLHAATCEGNGSAPVDGESAPAAAPAAEPTGTGHALAKCAAAAPECTFAHDTALEHDGCFDASPAACMIFRLRRREVFSPLACRICAQRRAAAAAAAAAISTARAVRG